MADSPDPPVPDDAPLSVGDDDVERLLKEAESLTAEIAEDAGVEAEPADRDVVADPAVQNQPGGEDDPAPDAAEAAARAEEAAQGLSDLLHDSDALTSAEAAEPPSLSSPAEAKPNVERPPPLAQDGGSDDDDGFSSLTEDDHAAFDVAAEGRDALARGGDEDEDALGDRSGAGDEEILGVDESTNPEQIAWAGWCIRRLKSMASWPSQVPKRASAMMQAAIVWTDRPFSGLSLGVKRVLGAVALASILTGIAAWILPGALEHNPFAEMPTDTAVDVPAFQLPGD